MVMSKHLLELENHSRRRLKTLTSEVEGRMGSERLDYDVICLRPVAPPAGGPGVYTGGRIPPPIIKAKLSDIDRTIPYPRWDVRKIPALPLTGSGKEFFDTHLG